MTTSRNRYRLRLAFWILCTALSLRARAYAQTAPGSREPVAVLPFETTTALPTEAKLATERVREELVGTGKFSVLDEAQVEKAMKDLRLDKSGCIVVRCAVQAGKKLSVRRVVTGSLSVKDSNHWVVSGFLVDVDKGETLKASTVESEGGSLSFIGDAVAVVAARIAEVPPPADLLSEGKVAEVATAKQEELKPKDAKPEVGPGARSGFGLFTGLDSHSGTIKTSPDRSFNGNLASANYSFSSVPELGLDYQWAFNPSNALRLFLILSAGGDNSKVSGSAATGNVDQSICPVCTQSPPHTGGLDHGNFNELGLEYRRWFDRLYVGLSIAAVFVDFNHDQGMGDAVWDSAHFDGLGFGVSVGFEGIGGWFVQAMMQTLSTGGTVKVNDFANVGLTSLPQEEVSAKIQDTGLWVNVGYRWK